MSSSDSNLGSIPPDLDAIRAMYRKHLLEDGDGDITRFLGVDESLDRELVFSVLFAIQLAHDRENHLWLSRDDYQSRYPGYETVIETSFELAATIAVNGTPTHTDEVLLKCKHCGKQWRVLPELEDDDALCPECRAATTVLTDETTHLAHTPATIDRFRIQRVLGKGSSGVVYKAYDPKLDITVAIKVPIDGSLRGQKQRERFLRDAQASSRLKHDNIVRAIEIVLESPSCDVPIIVADFVEGNTLDELLVDTPVDPIESARMIRDVANAIHYAHQNGVIHRDIKPSNIIIDPEKRPRVLDFGLAYLEDTKTRLTRLTRMTGLGEIMGTLLYMPPEQMGGHDEVTAQNDVYSLGAVLFRLITGRHVYGEFQVLHELSSPNPPPHPQDFQATIPRDLDKICWRCLQKNPHRRFASAEILAAELDRFINGEPLQDKEYPSAVKCGLDSLWRNRTGVSIASLAVLVLSLIVYVVYLKFDLESKKRAQALNSAAVHKEVSPVAIVTKADVAPTDAELNESLEGLGEVNTSDSPMEEMLEGFRHRCLVSFQTADVQLRRTTIEDLFEMQLFKDRLIVGEIRDALERYRDSFADKELNSKVDILLR